MKSLIQLITNAFTIFINILLTIKRDIIAIIGFAKLKKELKRIDEEQLVLTDLFRANLKNNPNKVCFEFYDKKWTLKDIDNYSNKIANLFSNKLELKKGDSVALFMENGLEAIGIWLGLSKIGVISTLINTNLRYQPLAHCIKVSNSKVVVYSASLEDSINTVVNDFGPEIKLIVNNDDNVTKSESALVLNSALESVSDMPEYSVEKIVPNDVLMYVFTSGTTGLPKPAVYCPFSSFDDITMYATIGEAKDPDVLVIDSSLSSNSQNGMNATSLQSLVQLNSSRLSGNELNGLSIHGGAGDVSLSHCFIEENGRSGVNVTYAGGLKEFNYTRVSSNKVYGIYVDYNVHQEMDNIFQNTTINSSVIEHNFYGGVYLGSYCNQSNITINGSRFSSNHEDGLTIQACNSRSGVDWYYVQPYNRIQFKPSYFWYKNHWLNRTIHYTTLNVSWNVFEQNRLNGLKIIQIQNMIGILTNNTFKSHNRGALLITANEERTTDTLIRNVSLKIQFNEFSNNSGRYALNVALNNLVTDRQTQEVNITFNQFKNNIITDPFDGELNARSSKSAVAIVSGGNIRINQNRFDNPLTQLQLATHLNNMTTRINASYNWFNIMEPVYDLNYFFIYRDKCNQQWNLVRDSIFDSANRSNLAEIIYWPYACNEKLWFHEASNNLRPPKEFDFTKTTSLGGVFDVGNAVLPARRYTVTSDITIKPNAKMTLKPGTELNFANGIGMLVLGELQIDGVQSSPVRFSLADQKSVNSKRFAEQQRRQELFDSTTLPNLYNDLMNDTDFANTTARNFVKQSFKRFKVELTNGRNSLEGRLIVKINGQRGSVCNRGWSMQNSKIACQQMGLIVDPALYFYRSQLSSVNEGEPILMSEVQCDQLDTSLDECRHTIVGDHTCGHEDDVWIKCLKPTWAGIRLGLNAMPSEMRYAVFQQAGQYDYESGELAAALHLDLNKHFLSNLTFTDNEYTSLEVMFNEPFQTTKRKVLNNCEFHSNRGAGLVTRSSFLTVNQLHATKNHMQPAVEYNPLFEVKSLERLRMFAQEPRQTYHVRQELTRLKNNQWHIGNKEMVMLYTDTQYDFGPIELNIQIQTDNDRVLVVDLIDYNPDFSTESIAFCEKFCQSDYSDISHKQWNLSMDSSSIFFPINTSYSALHINYNVTNLKSGRLTFLVYSVKAPEPVFDYKNPSFIYIRDIMPDNQLIINNSTFSENRHSIVMRHYDDTTDVFGNLRKRYNYSNIFISNCTFEHNDQVLWINTDPVIPNTHYKKAANLSMHVMHILTEEMRDDYLVRESGYELYDLVPSVKNGPLGRINVTLENSILRENYGGIRALYRYYEYSNAFWHFEIRNNLFVENKQSVFRVLMPRIGRHSIKNTWINTTHSVRIRNNEFSRNSLFEMSLSGYYAQVNITKNFFNMNKCKNGLIRLDGAERAYFIYRNLIVENSARYIINMNAISNADSHVLIRSLFVDNTIERNYMHTAANTRHAENSPSGFTVAIRGLQNCTFSQNIFENPSFEYEFVGGMQTNTLNSTIHAKQNWWGTANSTLISQRIFDIHKWNNHALVNYLPYCGSRNCDVLSQAQPLRGYDQRRGAQQFVLGGLVSKDLHLRRFSIPYQVESDLTIMPGATLFIEKGVEIEFYPNVGILVLGHLKASGSEHDLIKMRPLNKLSNQMTDPIGDPASATNEISYKMRLFNGLNPNEGFLQIFNSTLREWSWLSDTQFTLHAASLACKHLNKESRNVLIKQTFFYLPPWETNPIWNQTFICKETDETFNDCDTLANYHIEELHKRNEYTYLMCNEYPLDKSEYKAAWGGIRFARPYFESQVIDNLNIGLPQMPIFVKPDLQDEMVDDSFLNHVQIKGAGKLHGERSPAVQLVFRSPYINNCNITHSDYHGIEVIQPRSTTTLNKIRITDNLGYGANMVILNTQTTDQKSSYKLLKENTLSNSKNLFSMIDICGPHKYYDLEQRVLVYYKYSNEARDCIKLFRTRMSSTNLGVTGQIGIRFLQFMLVNNTIQNDTLDIYNGTLFRQQDLLKSLSNGSSSIELDTFYMSYTDTLSLSMRASVGREFYGFIAEVLVFPTSQYLSSENYIEFSDSQIVGNQLGALRYVTAGERNPPFYFLRNRIVKNGLQYFNTTSPPCIDLILQNTPKLQMGNNYLSMNYGGTTAKLYSGSGVLITNTIIYNNVFDSNYNDTILNVSGELELPYNELIVDKNIFMDNLTPRTDLISISGLLSKVTRNQIISNQAAHILFTQGFENVSTPRSQETAFNLFKNNLAVGIINDLEDPKRFRTTVMAASLKQTYHANYFFNPMNDFELTCLEDPLVVAYLKQEMSIKSGREDFFYWDDVNGKLMPKDRYFDLSTHSPRTTKGMNIYRPNSLRGLIAFTGIINATFNYWGTSIDSEIRARIRDKYDEQRLFEIAYSPAVEDKFELRDGKCELGWTLIDDTCYTYVGSHATYQEADRMCRKFEARLARETVAPIRLPKFRKLARTSQFNYDASSYRRMWLQTDHLLLGDKRRCTTIQDYGRSSTRCDELLPFICEKDPFFRGASFRFKDEIAFAIASTGALIICIVLLCLLWLYKSSKRKKQHIDRQNTLRSSARTHRHMVNSSTMSSNMNTSSSVLNYHRQMSRNISQTHLFNVPSSDNLSSTLDNASTTFSRGTAIYTSQRNQYFANKKHRLDNGNTKDDTMNHSRILEHLPTNKDASNFSSENFFNSGLDQNPTKPKHHDYGYSYDPNQINNQENNESFISEQQDNSRTKIMHNNINQNKYNSNQYHMYDGARTPQKDTHKNRQTSEFDEERSESNTITDDLSTEETKITNPNRFNKLKDHSLANFSTNTTDTFAENFDQNQIVVKNYFPTPKISPPNKQSTPDMTLRRAIFIQKDTKSEQFDNDKSFLLNDKIYNFNSNRNEIRQQQTQAESLSSGSVISKSNTNLTNISPMNSVLNNSNIYEINPTPSRPVTQPQFIPTKPQETKLSTPLTLSKQNLYKVNSNNLLQVTKNRTDLPLSVPPGSMTFPYQVAPPPPRSLIPPIPNKTPAINYNTKPHAQLIATDYTASDDSESVMSCQLITSSSLLLNREFVKQAQHIVGNQDQKPNSLDPIIAANNFLSPSKQSSQTQTLTYDENDQRLVFKDSSDTSKPPPMETCI